jgi:uncharacterized protein HemY
LKAALPLAEKAIQLMPNHPVLRNTLGVVYYRVGKYREAIDTLRANLETQEDSGLAADLYFLAMSHHRLGETERARDYFDWAVRWRKVKRDLPPSVAEELALFQAEAAATLGVETGK